MFDQYLAIILEWGGNFAPRSFALCAGQIVAIQTNTALFSLLGVNYGGNGQSNFGLPDLRGRIPIGQNAVGSTNGTLPPYVVGESGGSEITSCNTSNMPAHNHLVNAISSVGTLSSPANNYFAEGPKTGSGPTAKSSFFYNNTPPNTPLNTLSVSVNLGGIGAPMPTLQPYLTTTHIIATAGVFPPRN